MKPILFWISDRLILILFLVYVLLDTTLTAYEKCILFAVIGNMVVLKNIKDVIQDGFKGLGNSKNIVRNNNEEI